MLNHLTVWDNPLIMKYFVKYGYVCGKNGFSSCLGYGMISPIQRDHTMNEVIGIYEHLNA